MKVLILGGTAEARELAAALPDHDVVSSLAGRVSRPRLPVGEVRIGGFGGPEGLARWLDEQAIDVVVDATHPFAERISASAAQAAPRLLRLERPGWEPGPQDEWEWVEDLPQACAAVGERRTFLTTGRQGLAHFAPSPAFFLIRTVDPPEPPLPAHHHLILDRGPYTRGNELALIDAHRIELVVTKDSGGPLTEAKLHAARERGLPVIVVRRPPRPDVPTVATVEEAVAWVQAG
jgi:precorrin-6A/cobalt-precorrin-6A reductase